jgi:hypothetical protein
MPKSPLISKGQSFRFLSGRARLIWQDGLLASSHWPYSEGSRAAAPKTANVSFHGIERPFGVHGALGLASTRPVALDRASATTFQITTCVDVGSSPVMVACTISSRILTIVLASRSRRLLRRQRELKYGPPRFIGARPQASAMRFNDRTADRQAHPQAAGFRGVKGLKQPFDALGH